MADGGGQIGNRARPVPIRGVVYPSQTAAAEALGVSLSAIYQARVHGYLDRVGLPRMPVSIGGVTYPSARAASEATGHSVAAIYAAIERGDTGALGRRRPGAVWLSKPVRIGPSSWPSKKAAMRDLRVGHRTLTAALADPGGPEAHHCLGLVMAREVA